MSEVEGFSVGSGNVAGMFAFLDYLGSKNLATPSQITPLKSATNQVFLTVERNGPIDQIDVGQFDAEEYYGRFQAAAQATGRFAPETIRVYRNRFLRAVGLYQEYLATGQTPKPSARASAPARRDAAAPTSSPAALTRPSTDAVEMSGTMISYPFPLEGGDVAHLRLPKQLGKRDAARINAFVNALVFDAPEPPRLVERAENLHSIHT